MQNDEQANNVELLFVQSAANITLENETWTLNGVSPVTVFFPDRPDRPERIAGHVRTDTFAGQWSEGPKSFAVERPNASLSAVRCGEVADIVLELRNPRLQGTSLNYK